MSHNHSHNHAEKNLKIAFFLNLIFTIIELIGGIATNSIAIISDAVHDAGDTVSLGISCYLQKISKREEDHDYSYGYHRFSVLGALITGTVLFLGVGYVLSQAIPRLLHPQEVSVGGMLGMAVAGVFFNGFAVLRMRKGSGLNERVVSWHLLEDVLSWVAVLIGSLVMAIWDLPVVDPLLSIGISLFVLWNVAKNMRQVLKVFLQSVPDQFDQKVVERQMTDIPGVLSVHHFHSWTLDGERHVLTAHIVVGKGSSREEIVRIKDEVRKLLGSRDFEHVTVDVEIEGEECLSD